MKIRVTNCQECPFVNEEDMPGFNFCHVSTIGHKTAVNLPDNEVHENCPLKTEPIIVGL